MRADSNESHDQTILCSFLLSALLLMLTSEVNAQSAGENQLPETIKELRGAILYVLQETGIPAAGIALADSTGPVWIEGFGKANIEKDIEADEHTMFRLASTSKGFVALAVLKS